MSMVAQEGLADTVTLEQKPEDKESGPRRFKG